MLFGYIQPGLQVVRLPQGDMHLSKAILKQKIGFTMSITYCGFIAIIGRPNVGKSTLLNCLIGEKISITSRKPQTTRHKILGIRTTLPYQTIFVDTPGLHRKTQTSLNRYMNRAAKSTLNDVDAIIFVVDATRWTSDDDLVLEKLKTVSCPVILVINKIDCIKEKAQLLPLIEDYSKKLIFNSIFNISAKNHFGVDQLAKHVTELLPTNPFFFPVNDITDRSMRFFTAELIREKLMRNLGEEIPYSITVELEEFTEEGNLLRIGGLIWVEKDNHKQIVIGKNGEVLKKVGQAARLELEKKYGKKIFLRLWVKVKSGWSDDERALKSLGYE